MAENAWQLKAKRRGEWCFAYVADIHVGTPRSYRFQPAWNENWLTARQQIIECNPELLIVGGDLTRDGSTHRFELEQIKADLDDLPFPYHVIPGNHEVGNKYHPSDSMSIQRQFVALYRSVFGTSQWSFVHGGARFSGFDALLADSGLPEEVELWHWLDTQSKNPRTRHHVWFLHPALFIDDLHEPNWDVETDREAWYFGTDEPHRSRIMQLFKDTAADLVITAHIHCRRCVTVEGITFQYAPATAFPQWAERWWDGDPSLGFLLCHVSESGIQPEFVPLKKVSQKKGYGPGGNPPIAGRDYSVAWEKPALDLTEQRFAKPRERRERERKSRPS